MRQRIVLKMGLGPDASEGIDIEALQRIATQRLRLTGAVTAARRVVDIGRPWLRFLGWWRESTVVFQYQSQLDQYVTWMRNERGFSIAETDDPQDIRDRAILLLLAVYGMRSGEEAALRLDQIDWAGRTLRLLRLKRRQPQIYPLVPSAAEALARYIDTVRPLSSCPEVFLCMHAPRRPLKAGSIYDVANRRFVALGIDAAHRGGHALRHACASRLLAEGLSIKEIGDHLGHRSAASTSIYAKVNMQALREVGAFDLGGLQ